MDYTFLLNSALCKIIPYYIYDIIWCELNCTMVWLHMIWYDIIQNYIIRYDTIYPLLWYIFVCLLLVHHTTDHIRCSPEMHSITSSFRKKMAVFSLKRFLEEDPEKLAESGTYDLKVRDDSYLRDHRWINSLFREYR